MVIIKPTIINRYAKGKTSSYSFPSFKNSSNVWDASGKMCKIATLRNKQPANVAPIALNVGFVLKDFDRRGRVPKIITIKKKISIKAILSKIKIVQSSILYGSGIQSIITIKFKLNSNQIQFMKISIFSSQSMIFQAVPFFDYGKCIPLQFPRLRIVSEDNKQSRSALFPSNTKAQNLTHYWMDSFVYQSSAFYKENDQKLLYLKNQQVLFDIIVIKEILDHYQVLCKFLILKNSKTCL